LSPVPAAYTTHKGKIIKIFKARKKHAAVELDGIQPSPGKVIVSGEKLFVSANDGFLEILELQLESKKKLISSEFLKGYRLSGSDILGT
jgi:methionyl-tRNA formyltransferase